MKANKILAESIRPTGPHSEGVGRGPASPLSPLIGEESPANHPYGGWV